MKKRITILLSLLFVLVIMLTGVFSITIFALENDGVYTITYHLDGGTNAPKNPDVYMSEDVITLKDATKEGYDFAGWYLDFEKTEPIVSISGLTGDIDLYARYIPKEYNAVFNDNGATKSTDITITLNDSIGTTKKYVVNNKDFFDPYSWIPTRSAYVFAGWYNGNQLVDNHLSIDADLTLNAKWVLAATTNNGNKIILGENAKSVYIYRASIQVTNFSSMTSTYTAQYESSASSPYYSFSSDTYIYVSGNYKTITYTGSGASFSWDATASTRGGSITASFSIYDMTNKTYLVSPTYSRDATGVLTVAPGTLLRITSTSNRSGSDKFDPVYPNCTLTVDSVNPGIISVLNQRSLSQEFDATIATPNVKKTGYDFLGWYDSIGNEISETWKYTSNQTFTAKWTPTKYYISYELNGGTNNMANPSIYTIEDNIALKVPTKKGYTFQGWYLDSDFKTSLTTISKRTGIITLYAKFTVNNYNLTLDPNKGTFAPKVSFVSDGNVINTTYLENTTSLSTYRPAPKAGYIFGGWYKDAELTSLFKFTGTIADDITLYAKWIECDNEIVNPESAQNIAVNINGKTEQLYAFVPLNDGNITVTSSSNGLDLFGILYNSSKTILISHDDIDDKCLDFSYSYDVKAGRLYYISVKGNTATTSGYANISISWIGNCTITGTTYTDRTIEVVYDELFTLPDMATRDGYVFLGWFDETDTQITNGKWKFASNKTLTAKWREKTPQVVTFKDASGTIIATQNYLYGDTIIPPEFPAKAADQVYSYVASWDNDYSGICTGDVIYTVKYTPVYIDYSIIFKDENGAVLSTNTYHYGDSVIVPETPTKASDNTYTYKFKDWDTAVTSVNGDKIYTATYTAKYIDYTVTFRDEDGAVLSTNIYHYGDTVVIPDSPTKAADNIYTYEFAGWNNEVVACAGNTTYTATYSATFINYTVTFKDENGSIISTGTYHYGENIVVPNDPTKALDNTYTYAFAGWDSDIVACNGNKIYIATYTPTYIEYTVVFKDYDDEIISTKTYHYGDEIAVPVAPTRESDVIGSYTFKAWDSAVVNCAGDATYTATYNVTYIDYTVTFNNWNGDVISTKSYHYGDIIIAPTNPTREADESYIYSFVGWDKNVNKCEGNTIYTAQYSTTNVEYTVVFKDENGTVLSTKTYYYGAEVIVPNAPSKAADNTYAYTFAGWDSEVVACDGNKVYTATYDANYIDYTVIFKDADETVLSTKTYHYGDTVKVPETPTKAADNTYTYTFKGWDKEVVNCAGNATYTATYNSIYIDYTVIFKNEDGSVISEEKYHYGDTVEIPETPTKQSNNTYTYTFAGWGSEVVACDGNKVYTASFTPVFIEYTVVFKDWNGNVISSNEYHYGQAVTKPSNPTMDADNTYTYTFAGWDKTVTACTENTVYTATYSSTYIEYTIVFKNYDGSVLSTNTYYYGASIVVPDDPTKPADENCTYDFAGWDSEVTSCLGNKSYIAIFNPTNIDYTVVFKDWDGEVISSATYHFGDEIVVPDDPSRSADNKFTYAFKDWGKTVSETCVGDAEYTANYAATYIEYNIRFLDWDGSLIQTVQYHYGDTITAIADPERESDETYTYTFLSWNKALGTCTGNASFTAQYESTFINYTVVFKDYDGSVISRKTYHFGDTIAIPADPVRASDNTYSYTFKDWGNISTSCNGNKEYTAVYKEEYIDYTVTFKDHDGSVISSQTYHFGDDVTAPQNPTRTADNTFTYAFAGWDKSVVACDGDAIYTATYTPTFIDYTVEFKDYDGAVISTETYHYGDEIVVPTTPTKASDNTYTYTFKAWDAEVVACTGNATYTATYDSAYIDYTVIFKNEDGTVLSTNAYHYGDEVIAPTAPTKEADDAYTYTFAGWDKKIVACAGDTTYTATYSSTEIEDTQTPGTDTEPGTDSNTPSDNDTNDENEGLSGGAIAGIAAGSTVAVGAGGFSLFWFVIKKKKFADLIAIFKK